MGLIYFLAYLFLEILFSYEFARIFTPFGLFLEVIITAFAGVAVLRSLDFSMSQSLQKVLRREISQEEFISIGLFKLTGAILLIIPGVFSDITGLLLMFEPFARWVGRKFFKPKVYRHDVNEGDDIIDVEIVEIIDSKDKNL